MEDQGMDANIKSYYFSMSIRMKSDLLRFMCAIKDNEDLSEVAKGIIISKKDGAVKASKVAEGLYNWFKDEYDTKFDPVYYKEEAMLNMISILNRITNLELIWIQFSMKAKPHMKLYNEDEYFISLANNLLSRLTDADRRAMLLYPDRAFNKLWETANITFEEKDEVIKNNEIKSFEEYTAKYKYYF